MDRVNWMRLMRPVNESMLSLFKFEGRRRLEFLPKVSQAREVLPTSLLEVGWSIFKPEQKQHGSVGCIPRKLDTPVHKYLKSKHDYIEHSRKRLSF